MTRLNNYLGEFVYGAIDGSVTTFAVVAGAAGAHLGAPVVVILGFANLLADGLSMSIGSYLSAKSESDMMKRQGIDTGHARSPRIRGLITFLSFVSVGFIPLFIYVFDLMFGLRSDNNFLTASILTLMAFLVIGYFRSRVTHSGKIKAIAETLMLGVAAAAAAFFVGNVLEKIIT
ncbi:MAG: VIT1/CCC1 transporter family protein [Candidatus Doudnabacteria bacterium]|nr:VIT1/CCC1 transporter family protein [Candidatus Doudnabacteria bacterium]